MHVNLMKTHAKDSPLHLFSLQQQHHAETALVTTVLRINAVNVFYQTLARSIYTMAPSAG